MHTIFDDMEFKNPHAQDDAILSADDILEIENEGGEHPAVVILQGFLDAPLHLKWSEAVEFIWGAEDVQDHLPGDFILEYYSQYGYLPVGDYDVIANAPEAEIGQEQFEALGYDDSIPEHIHAYIDYEAFGRDILMDYDSTKNHYFREL